MRRIALFIILASAFVLFAAFQARAAVNPDAAVGASIRSLFKADHAVSGYPYQEEMEKAARKYGLPLVYVLAVARGESFFDANAVSSTGAVGVMQVQPETAADYGVTEAQLYDPAINIDTGVRYLADVYQRLGDPYLALGAYYCGCSPINKDDFTLRKDCDEYVRYINTHIRKIVSKASIPGHGGEMAPVPNTAAGFIDLATFDNFLEAEAFSRVMSSLMPARDFELRRKEVRMVDHTRWQYDVLASREKGESRGGVCGEVERKSGFALCRQGE